MWAEIKGGKEMIPTHSPIAIRVWFYPGIFPKAIALIMVVPFMVIDCAYFFLCLLEQMIPLDIDKGTKK